MFLQLLNNKPNKMTLNPYKKFLDFFKHLIIFILLKTFVLIYAINLMAFSIYNRVID